MTSKLAAALLILAAAPLPARAVTLAECVALARKNAPSLGAADADMTRAAQAVREARAALSLTLGLGASYVQNSESQKAVFDLPGVPAALAHQVVTLGSANQVDVRTEAQYTLSSGGRDPALVRAAEAGEQAQRSARAQAEADLILRVSQAYYLEVSAGRLQAAAEEALDAAMSHQKIARARANAGVAPKLDALRADVDVSQREIARVRAREARRMARVELEAAIGANLGPADTLVAPGAPGAGEPDSAAALAAALAARPELRALDQQIVALQEQETAARAGRKPRVGLSGIAEYRGPNKDGNYMNLSDPGLKTYNLQATLGLSMPILDGGLVDARASQLAAQRAGLEARKRDATLGIQSEVRRAFSDLRVAEAVWASNDSRMESATEALRLAGASYREGTATATEVRDAETALADARAEQAQSLMDYWSARARLDHATGTGAAGKEN